jgi:hypothetical protein
MQLKNRNWETVVAAAMTLMQIPFPTVGAEIPSHGCTKSPSSVVIAALHVREEDRLKAILKLGADHGVCLGILTDAPKYPVSMDESNIRFADIIPRFFPGYDVTLQPSITIIRKKSNAAWLDFRLKKVSIHFAPLSVNSMQIFVALYCQLNHHAGGIAGSIPSSINESMVGPLTSYNRSIFQLLNEFIIKSSKGGAWVVADRDAERGSPPSNLPFWKVFPYGIADPESVAQGTNLNGDHD